LGGRIDISKTHRSQGLHRHVKSFLGAENKTRARTGAARPERSLSQHRCRLRDSSFVAGALKKGSPQATIL
jgi:hypothetical protein